MSNENNGAPRNGQQTVTDADWRNQRQQGGQATVTDADWRNQRQQGGQATVTDADWRNQRQQGGQATVTDADWRNQRQQGGQATVTDANWRNQGQQGGQATVTDANWRNQGQQGGQATVADPDFRRPSHGPVTSGFDTLENFKARIAALPELTSKNGRVYRIVEPLTERGGESAVMLCQDPEGRSVVAKVFYDKGISESAMKARQKVLNYMRTPEGREYTLAVMDIGTAESDGRLYYFEITPYCRGGDISHEGAFAFDQIVGLAARLNEALQSIHNAGIIHRDIKPENLYRLNGKVVIGDFGIARTADDGFTTTFAGTPGYIPPWGAFGGGGAGEAFKLDVKWDYYSLAPTLASLYEGHDIYRDIDNKKRTQCITTSRLPLTKADPNRRYLEYLLFDLYQMLPDNMSGYEDVKKWVADHSYRKNGLIEQGVRARGWPRPFQVSSTESYDNEKDLFIGLTSDHDHWERAKKLLYAKYFEEFFKSFLPGVALAAQTADDEWRTVDEDKGLAVFLKALYPSGPLVWKGYTFSSLRELGERMKATSKPEGYAEILDERLISDWLAGTPDISVSDETVKLVSDIEKLAGTEPGVAVYWFGNAFAAEPGITVMDLGVSGVGDLSSVMFTSPRMFYEDGGLDMLLDRKKGAALYGFLYSLGYKDLIDSVMEKDSERSEFSKACVRIAMLEMIAEKEGDMNAAEDIKKFYVEYGPAAYAAYVKKLVERTNGPVYRGLDREGEHVLSEIKDYRLLTAGAFSDVSRSLAGLVTLADKMRGMLIDNPYLIAGGVYETHGVLCLNLVGCFAFEILGKKAPLGFASHIGQ